MIVPALLALTLAQPAPANQSSSRERMRVEICDHFSGLQRPQDSRGNCPHGYILYAGAAQSTVDAVKGNQADAGCRMLQKRLDKIEEEFLAARLSCQNQSAVQVTGQAGIQQSIQQNQRMVEGTRTHVSGCLARLEALEQRARREARPGGGGGRTVEDIIQYVKNGERNSSSGLSAGTNDSSCRAMVQASRQAYARAQEGLAKAKEDFILLANQIAAEKAQWQGTNQRLQNLAPTATVPSTATIPSTDTRSLRRR